MLAALAADVGPPSPDPADTALARTELADAVRALGAEGSPHRETWRLMYVEGWSVAEVAELMGVPAGTVKSRAHQARALMRAVLRRGPASDGGTT